MLLLIILQKEGGKKGKHDTYKTNTQKESKKA